MEAREMPTTTMQARFGEADYAVGRLVLERARAVGLSRSALVKRLRYQDLSAGHRALVELLMTGTVPPFMASRLADALEIETDLLDEVLVATARQQQDEVRAQILRREGAYRDRFRPHLRTETERQVPSPIFIAALYTTARLRVVPTPDGTWSANPEDRTVWSGRESGIISALYGAGCRLSDGSLDTPQSCCPATAATSGASTISTAIPWGVFGKSSGCVRLC